MSSIINFLGLIRLLLIEITYVFDVFQIYIKITYKLAIFRYIIFPLNKTFEKLF